MNGFGNCVPDNLGLFVQRAHWHKHLNPTSPNCQRPIVINREKDVFKFCEVFLVAGERLNDGVVDRKRPTISSRG